MNKDAPSFGRIFVISFFALTCFGLLLFLWKAFGGPVPLESKGYRIEVAFDDAATLANQSDVRIAGVTVGKVVDKELAPGGNRTLATLELEQRFVPLRSDARAILRQKTLLGETYVELTTGSKTAPAVEEGGRLADAKVAPAVEFDEFLRVFDDDTRKAFQAWQASAADAGEGRARDLSDGLGNLPVFASGAQDVVDVLGDRREGLRALVRNAGTTFAAITRNENALSTLIERNTQVFGELADHRESLAESIRIFPTFLDESKATLARLGTFSRATEPLIRDLDPVLKDTEPTLDALGRLSPDLRRLFADLDPLIVASRDGLPALSRTLRNLDPTLASAGPFLAQLNPILRFLEYNQVKLSDFLNIGPSALAGTRSTVPGAKTNGHVLPQMIMLGTQSLPAIRRSGDNRGNAYLDPVDFVDERLGSLLTFPSFDCNHVGEQPGGEHVGCGVSKPFEFQGLTQRFPNVREGGPGGVAPAGP